MSKNQFVFLELRTNNLKKAREFYTKLFGWNFNEMPMGKDVYLMIKKFGAAKDFGTGIAKNPAPKDVPSHWTPYIGVEDIEATTKKAKKLGAKILQEIKEMPWGFSNTIVDPTGAVLSLWQPKEEK